MVALSDALAVLYPTAVPLTDYVLTDDGTGPRISEWHLPGPQPTPELLAGVTPEQVEMVRAMRRAIAAGGEITSPAPLPAAVRVIIRVFGDRINAFARAIGAEPPLLEADVMADVMAGLAAGLGEPTRPDL